MGNPLCLTLNSSCSIHDRDRQDMIIFEPDCRCLWCCLVFRRSPRAANLPFKVLHHAVPSENGLLQLRNRDGQLRCLPVARLQRSCRGCVVALFHLSVARGKRK